MSVDADEAHRHSRDIDALNQTINQLAASLRTKLSVLSVSPSASSDDRKTSKLAQTQQRKLGKSFMAVMRQLEECQNAYKQQLRQQLQRQYLIVNPEATAADLESLGDDQQVPLDIITCNQHPTLLDDVFAGKQGGRTKDARRDARTPRRH